MPAIRLIEIRNFRGISELTWYPSSGLNCLIGPGDSGKSTVLAAIDYALGARRNVPFSDADFFRANVNTPIEITVTLGDIPDELLNLDRYGIFHRGYDTANGTLYDEPQSNLETVVTIKLIVRNDLQPEWGLYSIRAAAEGIEKSVPWAQRELIAPIKLDATSDRHLAWGTRSLLNKLSDNTLDISGTLAEVARLTRTAFDKQPIQQFNPILAQVKNIADRQGVQLGQLKALLDVNGVSLNNGAVSLHNFDSTPLRQLGTGSTRLLVSGIQYETSKSNIMLIDEAEHGLEPFRITKLLNNLGAKAGTPQGQVFITTHSPIVLRELQASQLWILRKDESQSQTAMTLPTNPAPAVAQLPLVKHVMYPASMAPGAQATLRSNAEAFFARKVLVCEGKTEIGLCRGLDLDNMDRNVPTWLEKGVAFADGAGDSMFERAEVFQTLGYPTAIFKDSDKSSQHAEHQARMAQKSIAVYEWGHNHSMETALFSFAGPTVIPMLLSVALERKGQESLDSNLRAHSNNNWDYTTCSNHFQDEMRPVLSDLAGKKKWFKDIEPMETIGRKIVGPYRNYFADYFQQVLTPMYQWLNA
ncbi:ATP-dependent nuclease [Microbulbifer epialgicus]|uniref:ATP-dependent endonuclease n=1 Tax=Microbulbifer epialgicus TaxID=393907 RepID=A0ABV4NYQ1_9GAMM